MIAGMAPGLGLVYFSPMRRHLATPLAALAAAAASLSLLAGTALADGSATAPSVPAAPGATPEAATATSTSTAPANTAKPAKPAKLVTSTKPTTKKTAPSIPALKAKAHLLVTGAFALHHGVVTVPGRPVSVGGTVRPYVAGQWVEVQADLGHRRFKTDRLRIKPSRNRAYGHFTETLRSPGAGIVHVTVTHKRTPQMLGFLAMRGIAALNPHAGSGAFVLLVQERLAALHFYMPLSGVYDLQTRLAVDAYHRLLRRGTSSSLDGATLSDLLDGHGAFKVRYPHDGTHAEGNLGIQLLALIQGSKVDLIYPISSGKPSTPTILGKFHVYDRVPGYLPDGMYYSNFFTGGYAIHGYDPAPDYPASHGCMRVPISDALSIWHWINYGDGVDTYY
jgi:lipoprotein-anchoring transpeptidase ErfK/SrfK